MIKYKLANFHILLLILKVQLTRIFFEKFDFEVWSFFCLQTHTFKKNEITQPRPRYNETDSAPNSNLGKLDAKMVDKLRNFRFNTYPTADFYMEDTE